jgi:hypothetical protein
VLHHPEARHVEILFQLAERAAVTHEEPVEEVSPRGIRQRLEDPIIVSHEPIIGDQMVTCQGAVTSSVGRHAAPPCFHLCSGREPFGLRRSVRECSKDGRR